MPNPDLFYDRDGITIWHGDNTDVEWPHPMEVGLLLTDPPYGMDYKASPKWNGRGIVGDNTPFDPAPLTAYRAVVFGAEHFARSLPPSKGWIVWEKRGGQDSTDSGLKVPDAELAWTNVTGRHRVFGELWAGPLRSEGFYHPTQKSVALMRWIVEQWSDPGGLVFDPFMGSGPVAQACLELGRRYVGIELVEEYCQVAVDRLNRTTPSMFEVADAQS